MKGRIITGMILILFILGIAYPDNITISRIDNSTLLVNQQVKVYISATGPQGKPLKDLTKENFKVFEAAEGANFVEKKINSFEKGVNLSQGVTMLLMLDNSGSMYSDASGKITDPNKKDSFRVTYAEKAILSLLEDIKNPRDKVGFLSFNVKIDNLVKPTRDKVNIQLAINNIKEPVKGERYTELFESLARAVDYLKDYPGRKVIILLSDGENFPLKDNPNFPQRTGLEGSLKTAQEEGITIFTIGLSQDADRQSLEKIARDSGGAYFSAYIPDRLEALYGLIREQVLNEYLLTYLSSMIPAENKRVQIRFQKGDQTATAQRAFYSATMFGSPPKTINWFFFSAIPVALLLLWLLSLLKFQWKTTDPSFELLSVNGKRAKKSPLTIANDKNSITISTAQDADITLVSDPKTVVSEAKVTREKGVFTIMGTKEPIMVNNKKVKTKVLRSGDVITVGNTTLVFDEGVTKTLSKEEKKGK